MYKEVFIRGHYRKNGVFVSPHIRKIRTRGPKHIKKYKNRKYYGNWNKLEKSLKKGYDPKQHPRGFITVFKIWFSDEYVVYDGSHRVKTLTKIYGADYQIEVKTMSTPSVIGHAIFLIVLLPIVIIWRKINGI